VSARPRRGEDVDERQRPRVERRELRQARTIGRTATRRIVYTVREPMPATAEASRALAHREVRPYDVERICAFPQDAQELFFLSPRATWPLTPEQIQRAIDQRFDSTVALISGEVSGFANFYVREADGTCAIGNVMVAPEARGRGVGGYLVETMAAIALGRHGAREVRISCFNANVAGLLLYSKLGFLPYGVERRLDPEGKRVALIHMRLSRDAAERLRREAGSSLRAER
jgi:ribosomal protein S18 acetylase RimI-like enzyme